MKLFIRIVGLLAGLSGSLVKAECTSLTVSLPGQTYVTHSFPNFPDTYTLEVFVPPDGNVINFVVSASPSSCRWELSGRYGTIGFYNGSASLATTVDTNVGVWINPIYGDLIDTSYYIMITPQNIPPCSISVSPSQVSLSSTGGSGVITVTSNSVNCGWYVGYPAASWLNVGLPHPGVGATPIGYGNGTVSYDVGPSTTPRMTTVSIGGQTVTVSQNSGPSVTFGPPPDPTNTLPYRMSDSHTLQVNLTGHFSQDATTAKFLQVTAKISGNSITNALPLPVTAIGDQPHSIFIDLASVPKFTDNQTFTILAGINEGIQSNTAQQSAEIPLPVVHVHGIVADCLGNPFPTDLFSYLQGQHPAYQSDPGTGRYTSPPFSKPYPTLVSFPYQSLTQSASSVAVSLGAWIQNDLLPVTHATKVNIVAHSLGGIIARDAVWVGNSGAFINKLVLVGSPAEGSTLAPMAKQSWLVLKALNLVGTPLVAGMASALVGAGYSASDAVSALSTLASFGGCVGAGNAQTTAELFPTYNWYSSTEVGAHRGGASLILPDSYINPLSPFLNNLGLHQQIRYYSVVASGWPTTARTWGRNWAVDLLSPAGTLLDGYLPFELTDQQLTEPGDIIVPLKSQLAACSGWPVGNGRGVLNTTRADGTLRDALRTVHTGYFTAGNIALADINQVLWRTDDDFPGQGSPMPRDSTCH